MRARTRAALLAATLLGSGACSLPNYQLTGRGPRPDVVNPEGGGPDGGPDGSMPGTPRTTPTNGGAVVMTADDQFVVAVNRAAHSVSVFNFDQSVSPPVLNRTTQLATGPGSEPWAAVLSTDGTTAYVILRHEEQLLRIDNVRTAPAIAAMRGSTGSEPTGIAISPSGRWVYVANWGEGTVSVFNAATMAVDHTIDLNTSLAPTGMLGTVTARPGLAHPRAIAVTNSGDTTDSDETVYVTEFFSQALVSGVPGDDTAFDVGRQGVVYRFGAEETQPGPPITLAPATNTGFIDSTNTMTGCFPNQLYAATVNAGRLYITGVCESPRGPIGPAAMDVANIRTELHAAVYVVSTGMNAEVPEARVLLTRAFRDMYDGGSVPDDGSRRMPLIPNDIGFAPNTSVAYVTGYGSDAAFRIAFNVGDPTATAVGAATQRFIDLSPANPTLQGHLPIGITFASASQNAIVLNENSRNASVVALQTQTVASVAVSADPPAAGNPTTINDGRRFFVTGLGRWSLRGQSWNSCEGCHPDGLTDNVTWYFGRGPRQTISLDGTFSPDGTQQRILNWTGIFDEIHDFELNTRGNSGGVGAVVWQSSMPPVADDRIVFDGTAPVAPQRATGSPEDGLNGSLRTVMPGGTATPTLSVNDNWNAIEAYVRTIRSPRAPTTLDVAAVARGRALFQDNHCGGCHGGPQWTISRLFYTPSERTNQPGNGLLRAQGYTLPAAFPSVLNAPANNAGRMAPLRFLNSDVMVQAANDQINCVLRSVGTFPPVPDNMSNGVLPAGSPLRLREVRQNMTTVAQGASGYNPPSLLGMVTGAPYLHGGNARTLEELFAIEFRAHYQALSSNFLDGGNAQMAIRDIVAFLTSIDDGTTTVSLSGEQTALGFPPDICPASFP